MANENVRSAASEELPEGSVLNADTGIVGFGKRYGEQSSRQLENTLGLTGVAVPKRDSPLGKVFIDTSFLLSLTGTSHRRRRRGKGKDVDPVERRHRDALDFWTVMIAHEHD